MIPNSINADRLINMKQAKDLLKNDFESEKDLCNHIEHYIGSFCKQLLGVELKQFQREYSIFRILRRKSQRIDFYIETKCGKFIVIECKNPTFPSELTGAIGQVLGYKSLLKAANQKADRLIIVTTKLDDVAVRVINENKLPIELIAIDKEKSITLCSFIENAN